jgi:general secretion pathway protein G
MGNGSHRERRRRRPDCAAGFTLIELLVVMAIIATLLSLVTPRYFQQTERAREVVLKHNLRGIRAAIDQYRQDHAAGPEDLEQLVNERYLGELPLDPISGRRDSWLVEDTDESTSTGRGIRDVHSGAPGNARDGSAYASW